MTIVARMVVVYNTPSGEVDLRECQQERRRSRDMTAYTHRVVYIEVDVVERVGSGDCTFWGGGVAVMVTTGGSQVVPGRGGGTVMGGGGG
jgi:hypothetical protein